MFLIKFKPRNFIGLTSPLASGHHHEVGRASQPIFTLELLQHIYVDFNRTFANIGHVTGQQTIRIYSNRIVKFDFIHSCSHYNEIQGINIELLTCIGNAVSKSNVRSYVVHQLKQSPYSNTGT